MGSSSFTEAFLKSGSLHPSPFPDRASMEQGFHADEFAGGGSGGDPLTRFAHNSLLGRTLLLVRGGEQAWAGSRRNPAISRTGRGSLRKPCSMAQEAE